MPVINRYRDPDNAFHRLMNEYENHDKIIIAYDFDSTVSYYTSGRPEPTLERQENEDICNLLRALRPYAEFILWTCRSYDERDKAGSLGEAVEWCKQHNIPLDYINEDGKVSFGGRKVYANIFLDDRAGLDSTYALLKRFYLKVSDEVYISNLKEILCTFSTPKPQ